MAPSLSWKLATFVVLSLGASSARGCWTYLACYVDGGTAPTPLLNPIVPSVTGDTTLENCQAACLANNYIYAGLEAGYLCYCDNAIVAGAKTTSDALCITDGVACFGNATEVCGGYLAMSVYDETAGACALSSSSSSVAPSSTSSTSSIVSSTSSSVSSTSSTSS